MILSLCAVDLQISMQRGSGGVPFSVPRLEKLEILIHSMLSLFSANSNSILAQLFFAFDALTLQTQWKVPANFTSLSSLHHLFFILAHQEAVLNSEAFLTADTQIQHYWPILLFLEYLKLLIQFVFFSF